MATISAVAHPSRRPLRGLLRVRPVGRLTKPSLNLRRAYIPTPGSTAPHGALKTRVNALMAQERFMPSRQIKLNAFMRPASIHTGAWRYPGAWPDMNFNFAHIKEAIQKLEAAKFDAFFIADHMALLNMPMDALKRSHTSTSFEPFTLLSALSQATTHIGLVATGLTTFDVPYHIARRFASLDHISGGRARRDILTPPNPPPPPNLRPPKHT